MKFVQKKELCHPGFGMQEVRFFLKRSYATWQNPGIDSPKEFHAEQALIFV